MFHAFQISFKQTFAVFKLRGAVSSLKYFIKVPFSIISFTWTDTVQLVYFLYKIILADAYLLQHFYALERNMWSTESSVWF